MWLHSSAWLSLNTAIQWAFLSSTRKQAWAAWECGALKVTTVSARSSAASRGC